MLGLGAAVIAVIAASYLCFGFLFTVTLFIILSVVYALVFHWSWCVIAFKTIPRDLHALICYIKILLLTRRYTKKNWTMPDIFHYTVEKHPDKPCFFYQDEVWTFKEVEDYSLRVTSVLRALEIRKGQVVGMLVSNCPQFPALWLGNARLGAITPLINTNQRGSALLHSITIASCDVLIFSEEFEPAIKAIQSELSPRLKLYKFSHRQLNSKIVTKQDESPFTDFTSLLEYTPPGPWQLADAEGFSGKLLYIYTSGTTGLPKAAVISNARVTFMTAGVHVWHMNKRDVIYCPLPLYHTAGGVISVGQALLFGCSVIIKSKFSASQFFPDCIKYKATVAHYIGEMCRYILATPPSASDTKHQVRLIYGNGLRPQIWNEFVNRFNIKEIAEFYGATEGNANIINCDGTPGAIGFVSRIMPWIYPIAIIKVDQETGEPIRDSRGLCQLAAPGEPGAFIGKINPKNPAREYLGYVDKSASEKKIVKDVFTHGDSAFISGDILVADELGYLYFRDRTGDTFRWRGENVSTTEVEAAISKITNHRDAVVYGVLVPNVEGRAGMCGIVDTNGTLDLHKLARDLVKELPPYAKPVFLRIMTSMDMTGTFKMKKTELQKEGFNPNNVKYDQIYYLDPKAGTYLPVDNDVYRRICSGEIRL